VGPPSYLYEGFDATAVRVVEHRKRCVLELLEQLLAVLSVEQRVVQDGAADPHLLAQPNGHDGFRVLVASDGDVGFGGLALFQLHKVDHVERRVATHHAAAHSRDVGIRNGGYEIDVDAGVRGHARSGDEHGHWSGLGDSLLRPGLFERKGDRGLLLKVRKPEV
jgi:hypothetical protein